MLSGAAVGQPRVRSGRRLRAGDTGTHGDTGTGGPGSPGTPSRPIWTRPYIRPDGVDGLARDVSGSDALGMNLTRDLRRLALLVAPVVAALALALAGAASAAALHHHPGPLASANGSVHAHHGVRRVTVHPCLRASSPRGPLATADGSVRAHHRARHVTVHPSP